MELSLDCKTLVSSLAVTLPSPSLSSLPSSSFWNCWSRALLVAVRLMLVYVE
ncbi:hypothetical protein [Pseudomonas corrugata]|uniref:hypothetical protein n=1 Tax=Pseudomonas corrugata TaxID=47879 RepID=UPI0038784021